MATAAVMLKSTGHRITGSDRNIYPPMSTLLKENNISVIRGFMPDNLDPRPDMVIIGNAVSRGNPEVEAVLERKIRYIALPELIKEQFIRGKTSLVVTGTHGKTTTTSILAWLFESYGKDPGFLIGGIPMNFSTSGKTGKGEFFIIEGDEYDTAYFDKRSKFIHYLPDTLIINNIEFDHSDIFESLDQIILSFKRLINIVPENGLILANADDSNVTHITNKTFTPVQTFAINNRACWQAKEITSNEDGTAFRVIREGNYWADFFVPLWGKHNVYNSLACIAAASHHGISVKAIQKALRGFKGVKRRLQMRGEINGIRIYDDFAHHPTAVKSTLKTVKKNLKGRKLWAVFEPRSNTSRTNLMQNQLTEALNIADAAIITGVSHPERIDVSRRLSPEKVKDTIRKQGGEAYSLNTVDEVVNLLKDKLESGNVVVGMSNGGFDNFYEKLLTALKE